MTVGTLERMRTPQLGRHVVLRPGTSDRQVWNDTFGGAGGYHLPPTDMPAPRTVLDLGANIGLTAAHYQALWPDARVVAVEMDADNAALIADNAQGVDVRVHAVSGEGGWGSYDPDTLPDAYAFTPRQAGGRHVQSLRLRQTILRSFTASHVDFVKMDIEGAEWGVLADSAGWAPLVRHLLVEVHGVSPSADLVVAAIRILREAGFEARRHPPHPQAVWAWKL